MVVHRWQIVMCVCLILAVAMNLDNVANELISGLWLALLPPRATTRWQASPLGG